MVEFYHFPRSLTFRGEEYPLYMCGFSNGSSSLFCLAEDEDSCSLHIFDDKGRERQRCCYGREDPNVLHGGAYFPNGSYAVFTQREPEDGPVVIKGTFYFPEVNKHRHEVKFSDLRVFANNWFALHVESGWMLYDNEGKVRADSDFCDVRVFFSGYALLNQSDAAGDVWRLYSAHDDSEPLRTVKGVEDFVGDGFVVVKTNERKVYSVQYFEQPKEFKGDVFGWHTFPGGCFYLNWGHGAFRYTQVFSSQSEKLSVVMMDDNDEMVYPLPSGYVVMMVKLATTCPEYHLYDPKGNKEGLVAVTCLYGNYYLIGSDLYDADAKCIGSGYEWVGECGIFQIFTKVINDCHIVYEVRNSYCCVYSLA